MIAKHTAGAFCIALTAFLLFLAEREFASSNWVAVQGFGMIALLLYLRSLYRDRRGALFTSFYQVFYWLGLLASAIAISAGTFMIEVQRVGTANGTFWLALMFFVAGMEMTVFGYQSAARSVHNFQVVSAPRYLEKFIIFSAIGLGLGLSAYIVIRYQGPILAGANRVEFWSRFSHPLALTRSIVTQAFFFAAYYYLWRARKHRRRAIATISVAGFVLSGYLALGEKFSLYIIYLNTWLFLIAGLLPDFSLRKRTMLAAAAIALMLFVVVSITYLGEGREIGFILRRLALQSQLLWSVLEDPVAMSLTPQDAACFFSCDGFSNGREFISERYLPKLVYEHYKSVANTLSGFTPALPFITFGLVVTVLLYLFASFLLGRLQRQAVNAFARENMVYGFLLFKFQMGFSMLVATANPTIIRGLALTAAIILLYHVIFAKAFWTKRVDLR